MFELIQSDGAARRGRLNLGHGVVETPVFMPCGTYGTVKGMTPLDLSEICLLYTSPSPRDKRQSRMPSSA